MLLASVDICCRSGLIKAFIATLPIVVSPFFKALVSRQDMANWAIAVAKKLESLIELMKSELLKSPYLHCDETFFQVMDEPGRPNQSQSYMWVTTGGTG
jgi:hypothetical protein